VPVTTNATGRIVTLFAMATDPCLEPVDGIMYAHVRVCLIEEDGDVATCERVRRTPKR
jgi:hypothetical protein